MYFQFDWKYYPNYTIKTCESLNKPDCPRDFTIPVYSDYVCMQEKFCRCEYGQGGHKGCCGVMSRHVHHECPCGRDCKHPERCNLELAESMKYADVVVNFASTITIDAAVFDTPIVCVNYDHRGARPFKLSPRRIYYFDHYAKLGHTGGFELANSKTELINKIDYSINHPEYLSENRKKIIEQQCVFSDGKSGERVANHILRTLYSIV